MNEQTKHRCVKQIGEYNTIKGGSRRSEKSCKVLMVMKAAKLGWAGAGAGLEQEQGRSSAGQEQGRSRNKARTGWEQGRNR